MGMKKLAAATCLREIKMRAVRVKKCVGKMGHQIKVHMVLRWNGLRYDRTRMYHQIRASSNYCNYWKPRAPNT
jgi:hypothetical protein